jgi:hypothetical protein
MRGVRTVFRVLLLAVAPPFLATTLMHLAELADDAEARCWETLDLNTPGLICDPELGLLLGGIFFAAFHFLIVLPLALGVTFGVRTGRLSAKAPDRVVITIGVAILVLALAGREWDSVAFGLSIVLMFALSMWLGVPLLQRPNSVAAVA